MRDLDLFGLDKDLARAARAQHKWLGRLRAGELDAELEDGSAAATSVATLRALQAVDDPVVGSSLRSWVYRLAENRVTSKRLVAVENEFRVRRHAIERPVRVQWSLSEMLSQALADDGARSAWLDAYARSANGLAGAVADLWAERCRFAESAGATGHEVRQAPSMKLCEAAEAWLETSRDAYLSLDIGGLSELLTAALAPDAREGWPGRVTHRTIVELVGAPELLHGLRLEPWALCPTLGPSSFLRALVGFGRALCEAAAPTLVPFVLGHDACGLRRHTSGCLFGLLPTLPEFFRTRMGAVGSRARVQARSVAVAVLIESRATALRALLRAAVLEGTEALGPALERLSPSVFGFGITPALGGALWRMHPDEGQRFAGLLRAGTWVRQLREAHDEDWFRNPRAIEELRARMEGIPETQISERELAAGARDLLDWLGERLD